MGASGDLAPLAHMSAAMIGEGEVFHSGNRVSATRAFKDCGLKPLTLAAKEGLALINGTQFSSCIRSFKLPSAMYQNKRKHGKDRQKCS